jgi:N4-gp56 family major capsid protein
MAELNAKAVQYNGANQAGGYTLKPEAYYDKLLLKMLRQMEFHYAKYAVEKSLPKNFGDTINWRRFNKLSVTKAPLIEGVTPDGQTVSGSEITAVIAQYGNVMYFTDVIDLQQLDKIRQEYTVELGFQAKETMDEIVRDVLVAEGSTAFGHAELEVFTTNSSIAVLAAGDIPRIDDFRRIVMAMKKGYIQGNRKAGGKYVALISPDVMAQLFEDEKVQNYMDFGRTNAMFADGMIVDLFGIRFEEVLNAPVVGIAHDSIIIGEEAYAITKLEGAGVRVITKGLGSAGVEDPLDQRQSIGWKITGFSAAVLNADAVVNYWSVPAFDTDTDDFDPALGYATLTFGLAADATGISIVRGPVKLPLGQSYTYNDFLALAGIEGNAVVALYDQAAVQGATAITGTTVVTANDAVFVTNITR